LGRIGMEDDRSSEPGQEADDADHDRHRGAPPSDSSGPPFRPLKVRANHAAHNRPQMPKTNSGQPDRSTLSHSRLIWEKGV
jgi:hypothetical protein